MNSTSLCPIAALVPLALLPGCTPEAPTGGEDLTADTENETDDATGPGVGTVGDDDDDDNDDANTGDDDDDTGDDDDDTGDDDDDDSDGPVGECGNGAVEGDEVCDDGIDNGEYDKCATDCSGIGRFCGDGVTDEDGDEGCDYGDDNGSSECNGACQLRGTVLATITESIDFTASGTNPFVNGIRVTPWNGSLTAVYGGFAVSVWEIDEENLNTEDLRVAFEYGPVGTVTGVVSLESGNLLLVGGNQFNTREAAILDTALEVQWDYDPGTPGNEYFVGAAPRPGGAIVGGRALTTDEIGFWAAGLEDSGDFAWEAFEATGTSPVPRDLRALDDDQAVLLTRTNAGAPYLRIYDAEGGLLLDESQSQLSGEYDRLCPGGGAFGLSNTQAGTVQNGSQAHDIAVFDQQGSPVHTVDLAFEKGIFVDDMGCAVRDDGSPIVAAGVRINDFATTRFDIWGFDGTELDWTIETPHNLGISNSDPEIVLDEHHAWVFFGGDTEDDTARFMRAVKVAI